MKTSGKLKQAKPAKIRALDGDMFIVRKAGRDIALGLVARGGKKGIKLGYFFPLGLIADIHQPDAIELSFDNAVLVHIFGSLSLERGLWPVIGKLQGFSYENWPMPVFLRESSLTGIRYIVQYDENDLAVGTNTWEENHVPQHVDLSVIAPDGMAGAGWVENYLEKILGLRLN